MLGGGGKKGGYITRAHVTVRVHNVRVIPRGTERWEFVCRGGGEG